MAQWLFGFTVIFFTMISPKICVYADLMAAFKNIIGLTVGAAKFVEEYEQFRAKESRDRTPTNQQEYDFIIVGAGSAGATLAARLSEISQTKVLLIEAGGPEHLIMDIPIIAVHLQFDKTLFWDHKIEPSNDYCLGMENHQCRLSIGKVMGGSSSVNLMIATRGKNVLIKLVLIS